jgi:glycosyltransferase involved in cell wall biosynthesis
MTAMSRLRILHAIDYFHPVLGYQETFLAREHARFGETLVVTSDRYKKTLYDANASLLGERVIGSGYFVEQGIKTLRLPTVFESLPLDSPWLIGLENAVTKFRPDLIIVHGIAGITSIRIARLKSRLPHTKLILDDHMTYNATRGWTNLFYKIFKRLFVPKLLDSVDIFVGAYPETQRFIQEMYGIPQERVTFIPLGIDRDHFHRDTHERNAVRKSYGIKGSEIVFIYAGKVSPRKGVHLFVEAGLQLCRNHQNVRFIVVGGKDYTYYTNLRKMISNEGKDRQFIFIDAVPNSELHKYFNAADVGVWPLQCSISMVEASGCGLPIIISDNSGSTERINLGNGLLYKESNVSDLASRMTLLLDDKTREDMSKKALAYVETLDWKNIAQRYLDTVFKRVNVASQ